MRITIILITIIAGTVLIVSCGGTAANVGNQAAASSSNSTAPRTNIEELALLVNIPYQPDDLVWREVPAQKRILAVMRMNADDSTRIVADSSAHAQPEAAAIQPQKWFPDELIAQAETSGDNTLRGQTYPATAFYQEPYTSGTITRIDGTDYFILDVTAK